MKFIPCKEVMALTLIANGWVEIGLGDMWRDEFGFTFSTEKAYEIVRDDENEKGY